MSYNLPLTNVVGMTSLKVENLANNVSSTTLKHVFEDYGPVSDIHIPQNPLTNEPYGFAFISFHNKCDAESAMNALNGILLYGCKLRVQMVHSDSQYAQPSCGQEGQYHNKEDSHEFQSHCERHSCHTTRIQSRYHSRSFPDQSESQSQSHRSHKRLPSTKRSKSKSSTSTHQLQDKPHARKRNPPGAKRKKHKSRSSHKQDFKCSKAGGENIKNKERTTEITDSELLFVRPHQSEESRSETITAHPHTTAAMTIGNPYPQKKSAFDE
ncbi:serine/arginine-rich splicing factor 2-like, partial [Sigmodon hispidus]